jgi:hypothetical protein
VKAILAILGVLLSLALIGFGIVSAPNASALVFGTTPITLLNLKMSPTNKIEAAPTAVPDSKSADMKEVAVEAPPAENSIDAGIPTPEIADAGAVVPAVKVQPEKQTNRPVNRPAAVDSGPTGIITVRAKGKGNIYVDNKKRGTAPIMGVKVPVGEHTIRVDCADADGNFATGENQIVTVNLNEETAVSMPCEE